METSDLPNHCSGDCQPNITLLKKQLADTEDKLVKFKKFVVTIRNERTELQEKLSESNSNVDKLKAELSKFQGKSYQQIFQNFQNLQIEYDKIQDEIELGKKLIKTLESDLLKCSQELSQFRETCANQKEETDQLKANFSQQLSQNNSLSANIKELESKIIVLQAECKNEKKKNNDFQLCENERNLIQEELSIKKCENTDLREKLNQALAQIGLLQNDIAEKDSRLCQFAALERQKEQLAGENLKHNDSIQSQKEQIEENTKTIEDLSSKRDHLEKQVADLQLQHAQKLSSLELTISELQNKLTINEQDLIINSTKFEEYKQRVSNVLKENKLNNFEYSKNIEDLNFKIEKLQNESNTFQNKCNNLEHQLETFQSENVTFKDKENFYQSELKNFEELKAKLNLMINENAKLTSIIDQIKVACSKEKQALSDENSATIENLKIKYENKIRELEDEIVNFRIPSEDSNSIGNSNASFEEIKDENISFPSSNNSNSERNFLEEILNMDSSSKMSDIPNSNIDNLTQLLSESENSITLLSEQNRLLKEEIRRLQRSVDRMDIANNLEYLKNVLMKFLTIKGVDERERLITVLTTILKLTPEERDMFHQCVQDDNSSQPNSKWSLWQWS